ncbi:peroxiredoxin [Thermoproteota archaeon]
MEKKIAPTFCLFNQNDERTCLKNLRGKWVILYFYPKDNSKSCTLEALSFTDNLKSFMEMGAVVVGVSPDSVKSHKNFAHKHNLEFILLSDPEHKVLNKYEVWKLKKMYGKEYMGVERSTFLINPEGIIEKEWRKVRVKGHVEEVKLKLSELKR